MLLRRDGNRRIAIPQPAHAGLSGFLAAAWGNADFPPPRPEAVLAAALHDIGWAAWERAPTRDPEPAGRAPSPRCRRWSTSACGVL